MNRAFTLTVSTLAIVYVPSMRAQQSQAGDDAHARQMKTDYAVWMRPYQTGPLKEKLIITAIEGDGAKADDRSRIFSNLGYTVKHVCSVSTGGRLSSSIYSVTGVQGSGGIPMPEADRTRLDALLAELPDDFSTLPPPDRRLVLQVADGNQVIARVYDRANAPERILEILRLTNSNIRSWLLTFQPKDQWKADGLGSSASVSASLCLRVYDGAKTEDKPQRRRDAEEDAERFSSLNPLSLSSGGRLESS